MQLAHLIAALVLAPLPGGQTHPTAGRHEFVGSTPCDAEPRRFFGISGTVPCERITWQLALAEKQDRSTFSLQIVYGMQARNDPGFQNGGTNKTVTGTWADAGSGMRRTLTSNRCPPHSRQPPASSTEGRRAGSLPAD